jgi:hypothetical protein
MRSGRNGAQQVKFSKHMQPPQTRPLLSRRPSFWEHAVLTGVFLASEWSIGMPDRVTRAVEEAQAILARYVGPGPRDSEKTINDLLTVLDDERLVQAMEEGMSDNLTSGDQRDRSKINMHEEFQASTGPSNLASPRTN